MQKAGSPSDCPLLVLALPIFPVRLQTSIFGAGELNFCVRDGNRWTLTAINTNYFIFGEKNWTTKRLSSSVSALPIFPVRLQTSIFGAGELNFCVRDGNRWTLTAINTDCYLNRSRGQNTIQFLNGDPYRIRTDVNGVRGRCLNHLTNGPFGAPSGIRTRDPLIKSQLLYQLS